VLSPLPPSITHTIVQTEYAAAAMTILEYFGLESLVKELLAADGVHNLGNLLSLQSNIHTYFDNLDLWFEGTDVVRYS
jgi:hypothetical protein